jgi:hypothetical protein
MVKQVSALVRGDFLRRLLTKFCKRLGVSRVRIGPSLVTASILMILALAGCSRSTVLQNDAVRNLHGTLRKVQGV